MPAAPSRLERDRSCWPEDLGYGRVYFYEGQFCPAHLIPKCRGTGKPVNLCDCPWPEADHPETLVLALPDERVRVEAA